jgi:tagatose-1,6-bisphosphate aldolase non-catalytic subunit AgaZ/GatZ
MRLAREFWRSAGLDPVIEKRGHNSSASLQDVLIGNRRSGKGGVYAVCSAHPWVIDAAIKQAMEDDSVVHVESTSSQVNQLGGYSGQTPSQFADFVKAAAQRMGLSEDESCWAEITLGHFRGERKDQTALWARLAN